MMKQTATIFPDTNVLLHFPPLADIDWCGLANASAVHLVLCMQVIQELDRHKYDARLHRRAERAIKEIQQGCTAGVPIRPGVTIAVFNQVGASGFPDADEDDGKIVHQVQLYSTQHPKAEAAIATNDYGMKLRCEACSLKVISLDASLQLPPPEDELRRKLKQVTEERDQLKLRLPRLSIGLSHAGADAPEKEPHFCIGGEFEQINVDARVARIQERYPMHRSAMSRHLGGGAVAIVAGWREDWDRHDEELGQFYSRYRGYLENLNAIAHLKSRCVRFDLWLTNSGKGIATDVDVFASFPEDLGWVAAQGSKEAAIFEKKPRPPKPPPTPLRRHVLRELDLRLNTSKDFKFPDIEPIHRDEREPWTEVTKQPNGLLQIRSRIQRVKHWHPVNLGPFWGVLRDMGEVKPFELQVAISAAELPDKVIRSIPFIVRAVAE